MSYCVNCGVELADSEKYCPLCRTEVINPRSPYKEPSEFPYPRQIERIASHIDRRFFASISTFILLLPAFITILCDLLTDASLNWSAYVIGALAVLFVWVVMPFYFKRYNAPLMLSSDCLIVLLYLLLIEKMTGGDWFLPIGLPITLCVTVCMTVLAAMFSSKKHVNYLVRAASVFFSAGILVVLIELVLRLYNGDGLMFRWSPYALIPCVLLGLMAIVVERRKNLREEIRRRLFF